MQFRDLLTVLGTRWRTLVACLMLVVGAAAVATTLTTPIYEARARFFFSATAQGSVASTTDLATLMDVLGSPVLGDALRTELGVDAATPLALSGVVSESAPTVDITVQSPSPELAAQAANAAGPQLARVGSDFLPMLAAGPSGQRIEAVNLVPATIPTTPKSPDLVMNLVIAALAGLALGVGVVLIRHFMDTRVRTEVDVRTISQRPILGSLRKMKDATDNRLVMETDPHSVAAEEYRRLRTNLQFVDVTTGGKHSFVVTSASAGEGKTTTAINLAMAMADAGSHVLLVDADLRHPSVADSMGLEGGIGLTTVLLGRATIDQVTQQWRDTSLHVLAAGTQPPNPSELLGSDAMAHLFRELLDLYDFVIVDSPPIVPVIDPVLINRLVGGLLLVVRVGETRKRELTQAVRSLATVDADVSGFALNMVEGGGSYYAYGDREARRSKPQRAAGKADGTAPVEPVLDSAGDAS